VRLTWAQVRARRLARSRLTEPAPSIVEAVRDTCGIQAQLQSAAALGVRLRVGGEADVGAALWDERSLVRTWTLRGTIHLHPAAELGLWTAAVRAATTSEPEPGLLEAFESVLSDGVPRLREELADEVSAHVGEWARKPMTSGWGYLLGDAARAGILCNGPPRGAKVTFVHARRWLGDLEEWDEQEALREMLRRYVRVYGPVHDAAYVGAASLDPVRDELAAVDVEGKRGWILEGDDEFPDLEPSVFLLPQYDAYVLGFRERDRLLWGAAKELYWDTRWLKRGRYESPVLFRNVLVDGVVAGKWSPDGVRLAEPLDRRHAELLEAELARVRTLSG
jgi:hypothetical protein